VASQYRLVQLKCIEDSENIVTETIC
jgi:hypothetical protein